MFKHLIAGSVVLFICRPVLAITSMEDLHLGTPKDGFSGDLDLRAGGSSGNSDTSDFGLGSRLQWHQDGRTDYLLLSAAYGESNGVQDTEKWFVHGRHIQRFDDSMDWEAYAQGSADTFARLNFRGLLGGGVRLHLANGAARRQVILGLGGYYSREELAGKGYPDGGTDILWRANTYLVLKAALSDNATLVSTTYYQPALDAWDDYRLLEQAGLKVAINQSLALKITLDVNHDSRPPQGVEKTDISYSTSLSYAF